MKKIFIAGYLDDRNLPSSLIEGTVDYNEDVEVYNLEEVLKLSFVEPVCDWFNDENDDMKFESLAEYEKIEMILKYTQDDEIAGLEVFDTEERALARKEEVLEFRREIKSKIESGELEYVGKEQNLYGEFYSVYMFSDILE